MPNAISSALPAASAQRRQLSSAPRHLCPCTAQSAKFADLRDRKGSRAYAGADQRNRAPVRPASLPILPAASADAQRWPGQPKAPNSRNFSCRCTASSETVIDRRFRITWFNQSLAQWRDPRGALTTHFHRTARPILSHRLDTPTAHGPKW